MGVSDQRLFCYLSWWNMNLGLRIFSKILREKGREFCSGMNNFYLSLNFFLFINIYIFSQWEVVLLFLSSSIIYLSISTFLQRDEVSLRWWISRIATLPYIYTVAVLTRQPFLLTMVTALPQPMVQRKQRWNYCREERKKEMWWIMNINRSNHINCACQFFFWI